MNWVVAVTHVVFCCYELSCGSYPCSLLLLWTWLSLWQCTVEILHHGRLWISVLTSEMGNVQESLVSSSSDTTGTKEFLFFYHTREHIWQLSSHHSSAGFFSFHRCPFETHFGFWFFWLGLVSSLSLSLSLSLCYSFCWVFCLMELARVSSFSSLLWFQKLGDLFLVFNNFFELILEKLKISYFSKKKYHHNAKIHPKKEKKKKNNFVHAPPPQS